MIIDFSNFQTETKAVNSYVVIFVLLEVINHCDCYFFKAQQYMVKVDLWTFVAGGC